MSYRNFWNFDLKPGQINSKYPRATGHSDFKLRWLDAEPFWRSRSEINSNQVNYLNTEVRLQKSSNADLQGDAPFRAPISFRAPIYDSSKLLSFRLKCDAELNSSAVPFAKIWCVFASLIPQVYSVETARLMAQGGCWALSGGDRAARWRTSTVLLREHRVNDGRIRTTESRALKKRRDEAAYEDASTGRDSEFKSSSLK
ncbi:hypothetical protein R3P38DRAFT_2813761 [Favolaschia claudopus]|uniref:Uncharacterized protein n=1 Tax=Favolaschia claudopus TaxID=2862362 RepID=A0AAV9Z574_9AGAR